LQENVILKIKGMAEYIDGMMEIGGGGLLGNK
jgi:hypothetical protein